MVHSCNKPFIIVLYFSLFLFLFLLKNESAVLGWLGQEKLAKVQLTKTSRQLAPNEILIWILFIIQCGVDYSKKLPLKFSFQCSLIVIRVSLLVSNLVEKSEALLIRLLIRELQKKIRLSSQFLIHDNLSNNAQGRK